MSLCEWDPERGMPATELHETRWVDDRMERVLVERCGCPNEAAIILGADGQWRLCASCAELSRFRRYRVARVIDTEVCLRRDSAGWWVDGLDFPERPAALAEVLEKAFMID